MPKRETRGRRSKDGGGGEARTKALHNARVMTPGFLAEQRAFCLRGRWFAYCLSGGSLYFTCHCPLPVVLFDLVGAAFAVASGLCGASLSYVRAAVFSVCALAEAWVSCLTACSWARGQESPGSRVSPTLRNCCSQCLPTPSSGTACSVAITSVRRRCCAGSLLVFGARFSRTFLPELPRQSLITRQRQR